MLGPNAGVTLVDSLVPPAGYRLDIAVGTTFTLDLVALLAVPAAFSLAPTTFDDAESPQLQPLSLLESLRTYAGRVTVFCDADRISLPDTSTGSVLAFLDSSVVPVSAPRGGYFHPKMWIVRFHDVNGHRTHRILIPSRNLTFDSSWDTLVRLDQVESGDQTASSLPEISRILTSLQGLARDGALTDRKRSEISDLASGIKLARFAVPDGFDDMRLHAFGFTITGNSGVFDAAARQTLVVSPFLGSGLPLGLGEGGGTRIVSRPEMLDRAFVGVPLDARPTAYILNPALSDHPDDGSSETPGGSSLGNDGGLHAKLFVQDGDGGISRVFTGSANATANAFSRNTEVLIELTGLTRRVGTSRFLARNSGIPSDDTMRSLVVDHTWSEPLDVTLDPSEANLTALQAEFCATDFRIDVGKEINPGIFDVRIWAETPLTWPADVSVEIRPVGQKPWTVVNPGAVDVRTSMQVHEVTRFLGVRIELNDLSVSFVVAAELIGAPEDRYDRLLSHLLASPERLIRYLLILLSDDPEERFNREFGRLVSRSLTTGADLTSLPLLEMMLRAVVHEPQRLREISALMTLVRKDPAFELTSLIELWDSVSTVVEVAS